MLDVPEREEIKACGVSYKHAVHGSDMQRVLWNGERHESAGSGDGGGKERKGAISGPSSAPR